MTDAKSYFAALHGRLSEAQAVPYEATFIAGVAPRVGGSHRNVDSYIIEHAGFMAVRGWLTQRIGDHSCRLVPYSVVTDGLRLFDITPADKSKPENQGLPFLRHVGEEALFQDMSLKYPQCLYPEQFLPSSMAMNVQGKLDMNALAGVIDDAAKHS
ncbi:MAG: hypothetical protein WDO70_03135 [Alphaproteobacteria bacterium]